MMSSLAAKTAALKSPVERRFYPRFVPSAPIRIGPGKLFNICENGLLISTPITLKLNSVLRISLKPEALPNSIQVCARVVWTDEPTMLAGIQLLDLSDQGREQIREWGMLGSSGQNVKVSPVAAKEFVAPFAPTPRVRASKEGGVATPMSRPAGGARIRLTSALQATLLGLLVGTLSAGAVLSVRGTHSPSISAVSAGKSGLPVARAPIGHSSAGPSQGPDSFATGSSENKISGTNPLSVWPSVQIIPPYASAPQAPNPDPADPAVRVINRDRAVRNQGEAAEANSEQQRDPSAPRRSLVSAAAKTETDDGQNELFNNEPLIANSQDVAQQPNPGRLLSVDRVVPFLSSQNTGEGAPSSVAIGQVSSTSSGPIASDKATLAAGPPPSRTMEKEILRGRADHANIIQMVPPQGSVLEILVPEGSHSSVLGLPNEQVLESPYITTRIRRTILLAPTRNRFFHRRMKVAVGELVSRVDPEGPRDRIYSDVSVRTKATIAPDGHVERVQSLAGPATLASSVMSAVYEWRYQPTLVDDKPVETECYIQVQFHASAQTARQ